MSGDPRRTDKIKRFGASDLMFENTDATSECMSVMGILFSVLGFAIKMKCCAWIAIYCSCIGFASSRVQNDGADTKQLFSSFMQVLNRYTYPNVEHFGVDNVVFAESIHNAVAILYLKFITKREQIMRLQMSKREG